MLFQSIALSSNEECFGAESASNEKAWGGGGVKRLTNTKRLKQRLTEHTWEMEAELRVESFLFVSVQSEKAI